MSASVEGEIVVTVAGGVLYLGYLAAYGTVWTVGKLIQGTATIVGDALRGRRMRLSGAEAAREAGKATAAADLRTRQRMEAYERQIAGLHNQQQRLLHDFQQQTRQQQEHLRQSLQDLQTSQRAYIDRRCEGIEEDLRHAENRFEDKLICLSRTVDQRFQAERQHFEHQMAEQAQVFSTALGEQRSFLQAQIDQLNQRIENEEAAAGDWLAAAEASVAFIRASYRHAFFCPGELEVVERRLALAQQNMAQGMFQATLAVAQEGLLQSELLHQKLELLTQEWETHRVLALESLEVGLETLEAHRRFQLSPVQVEGGTTSRTEPGQEVNSDYWTQGQWSARQQALAEMRWRLADDQADVSIAEVKQIAQAGRDAPTQAIALAASAKYALMASVLRADMQREFAARLAESGYQIVDNAWSGNDERRANHMLLRGVNGDEIAIVVSPKEDAGPLSNRIAVHFRDNSPSEAERKEKLEAIYQVLNQVYQFPRESVGLHCLPGTEWQDNASAEHFDLAQVRQAQESRSAAQPG